MPDVPYRTHVETQVPLYNLEIGWLIEAKQDLVPSPPSPIYLCIASNDVVWTVSHNEALRFARKQDAEAFWKYASRLPDHRRTQATAVMHGWHTDPK